MCAFWTKLQECGLIDINLGPSLVAIEYAFLLLLVKNNTLWQW
jgi:hypothetical protein